MRKIDKILGPVYRLVKPRRRFIEYPFVGPVRSLWGNNLEVLSKLAKGKSACS
jgi:hypothetical protein